MIMAIAWHFSSMPCFRSYTFREDMCHDAVARCIQAALPKLDPDKEPFSYLTTTIRNVFLSKIHKEKKFWSVKRKIYEELTGKECNWKDGLRSEDDREPTDEAGCTEDNDTIENPLEDEDII